jgi:hypothetical protein
MKKKYFLFILTFIILTFNYASSTNKKNNTSNFPFPKFMWGFSHALKPETIYVFEKNLTYEERLNKLISDFKEVGVNFYRTFVIWNDIDETIENINLKLHQIDDKMINKYIKENDKNFKKYDILVEKLKNNGIDIVFVLSAGYTWELPKYRVPSGRKENNLKPIIPDNIGKENYIAQAVLHSKAVTRRYKHKVKFYLSEAELNVAGETVLWGWRDGSLWKDWDFLTELLKNLYFGVKEECKDCLTTMNFHTDITFEKDVSLWVDFMDFVSLDAFPNYLSGFPVKGKEVGRRVKKAISLSKGKPVVVMETGYATNLKYLVFSGHTEERQAQYIKEAAESVYRAGGRGFFYFSLVRCECSKPNLWEPEEKYGLIRKDNTKKKGFYAYKEIINIIWKKSDE